LSQGTVGTATAVTKTFEPYVTTHREALDAVMGLASAEYRIQPDFTVDSDDADTLFGATPTVVVTRKAEGPDGAFRGVEGGLVDQNIDVSQIVSNVIALTEGAGSAITTGSSSNTPNLNAPKGSAPDLVVVISAPAEESANASTLAANYKTQQGKRTEVRIASTTHHLPRHVVPGNYVYVYDPTTGLVDSSNQIQFRGETITPAKVRLLSYTWPIEQGVGVYLRSNESTPTYTDLTDWVAWETGTTWWTVGDWSPPSYGRANRINPEIEERVGAGWHTFTPSWTNVTVGNATNNGLYRYADGGMWVRVELVWGSTTSASSAFVLTLPNSETSANDGVASIGVGVCRDDTAGTEYPTVARCAPNATAVGFHASTDNVDATNPFTWTTSDYLEATIFVAL
jgi:hypothetical protein